MSTTSSAASSGAPSAVGPSAEVQHQPGLVAAGSMVDPRGPRFVAAVTTAVLAVVLLTGNVWLIAAQTVVFALGAFAGLHRNPYSALYRWFVRPRLGPPRELEASEPPRFAQGVGFAFALFATVALALGATTAGLVAVGLALAAAFLNAAFGFCLGCEMYLLGRRVFGERVTATPSVKPVEETAA